MKRLLFCLIFCFIAASPLLAADLKEIENDPNLEHRARLALEYADSAFLDAKTAYAAGDVAKTGADLQQMQAGVVAAQAALAATGKNARRHSKPFKLAETVTRDLLRKLDGFSDAMDLADRKLIDGPKAKVQEVHDRWLDEIILGKQ